MNPEIAKWVGLGILYLFIAGILWRCVFGNLLDDIHERLTNSRMDFFLLVSGFCLLLAITALAG